MMTLEEFHSLFIKLTNFKKNRFHPLVWITGTPEIGDNVYIGGFSEINAQGANIVIGDHCDIASFVSINCADSHKQCIGIENNEIIRKDIKIENNVFIGSHSFIKGGVYIGHHSVIAAGTIVDQGIIPPYSLVAGNPMTVKKRYFSSETEKEKIICHNQPSLSVDEEKASLRVLQSAWVAQGKEVACFENECSSFLHLPEGHSVAVSSGTAALYLALWALQVKEKKVAIPIYACNALRNAVVMNQAQPVLIDNAERCPNIDVHQLLDSKVEHAIIPHMYGIPVDITSMKKMDIIEDCAHSFGAAIEDTPVGLVGAIGICSFYATKLITTGGQGGLLFSKNKALIDLIKDYRDFDQKNDQLGRFNFQMTDLQAAIGREQLKRLPFFLERRKQIYEQYKATGLSLLDDQNPKLKPVRYRAIAFMQEPNKLLDFLKEKGIKAIIPIEEKELAGEEKQYRNAYHLANHTISLPLYPNLSNEEVDYIVKCIQDFRGGV